MEPQMQPVRKGVPARLLQPIKSCFNEDRLALSLFNEFLARGTYDRPFALDLIRQARDGRRVSWEVRRLAVLMLEHQVLKIPVEDVDELDYLLVHLGLKSEIGRQIPIDVRVIREGYSTTEFDGFSQELRRRLQRLDRVHKDIRGLRTSAASLREFIELSRRDCKLTLARYVFQPREVVRRILSQVRISRGVLDVDPALPVYLTDQIKHTRLRMPEFEASILDELCKSGSAYWVAGSTSSELNSLVEYPVKTVVLVIKPPGSDIEFEIKRAGYRGARPLSVVFHRDGWEVPPAHRLDGGAMQWLLRHEALSASRFARIYRTVHAADAPVPTFMSRTAVNSVPAGREEEYIAEYFTNPCYFGAHFKKMREAMKHTVNAVKHKNEITPLDGIGDLGLTVQFLAAITPAQGIICGTTSFRLDKIAQYLSANGPEIYFKDGLVREYSKHDGKSLADETLEEVLGVFVPPDSSYRSHKQYVEQAFRVPANRERANQNYFSIISQIGAFWGSLLAVRGYTWGESFVGRNVGLKSVWDRGQWKVTIIFMDHDNMNLPDVGARDFFPNEAFPGFCIDASYVGGGLSRSSKPVENELDLLAEIYRIDAETAAQGKQTLFKSMKTAYRKTHREMVANPWFQRLFNKVFVERIRDWDILANSFLAINGDEAEAERWKQEMEKVLLERGYSPNSTKNHLNAVRKFREFIEKKSFLYEPRNSFLSRS